MASVWLVGFAAWSWLVAVRVSGFENFGFGFGFGIEFEFEFEFKFEFEFEFELG